MNRIRTSLGLLALGVASLALVACDGASANEDEATETSTATVPAGEGGSSNPGGGSDGAPGGTTDPGTSQPSTAGPDTPVTPGDPAPAQPGTSIPVWDHERVEEEAPIESVDIVVRESFPPQYSLEIVSGLPSGCAAFERIDLSREGDTFTVKVINTMPAPNQEIACTMIYGYLDHSVSLEDIESGVEYTVHVNDQTITFTGQ